LELHIASKITPKPSTPRNTPFILNMLQNLLTNKKRFKLKRDFLVVILLRAIPPSVLILISFILQFCAIALKN
jgi:hypothetical protein